MDVTKAYYNENDPKAAATLRELIRAGLIADGDVDERSIEDVAPAELVGYRQRHFFAGFGIWSYALRSAGWPDDWACVTGSCPCQPFSAAGKGVGFADERHLWPAFYWHIMLGESCPVFGEQVASEDGLSWLDVVCADLECAGYRVGAFDLCAAGFGAPHIRQRLYWVAEPKLRRREQLASPVGSRSSILAAEAVSGERLQSTSGHGAGVVWVADAGHGDERVGRELAGTTGGVFGSSREQRVRVDAGDGGSDDRMGSPILTRLEGLAGNGGDRSKPGWIGEVTTRPIATSDESCGMADTGDGLVSVERRGPQGRDGVGPAGEVGGDRPGPTNGFWRDADWLRCRPEPGHPDGRWRPVEPGTFPLAHGYPERMGILRGAGNAIVAPQAEAFIRAYREARGI